MKEINMGEVLKEHKLPRNPLVGIITETMQDQHIKRIYLLGSSNLVGFVRRDKTIIESNISRIHETHGEEVHMFIGGVYRQLKDRQEVELKDCIIKINRNPFTDKWEMEINKTL